MRRRAAPCALAALLGLATTARPLSARADGTEVVVGIAPPTPAEAAAPEAEAPATASRDMKIAAAAAGGVALVGAGAGVVFGVLALHDKSRFDDAVTGTAHLSSQAAYQAGTSATENAVLADVCFGGAVVAVVTGVVLLVRSARAGVDTAAPPGATPAPEPRAISWTVTPMITSHGGGAGAALTF